jgi:hypothetical protein
MLAGDTDAALVLNDVIEDGVSGGKTVFLKIKSRAGKSHGISYGGAVKEGSFAAVTPGRQIVLFGIVDSYPPQKKGPDGRYYPQEKVKRGYVSRFRIGDTAEYDSYNLVYFGKITSITAKRVTIDKGRGSSSKSSLDIERFSSKNWDPDNLEQGMKRNREWSD